MSGNEERKERIEALIAEIDNLENGLLSHKDNRGFAWIFLDVLRIMERILELMQED